MKKRNVIMIMILVALIAISFVCNKEENKKEKELLSYYLETNEGYEFISKIPTGSYEVDYAKCGKDKIKGDKVELDKETGSYKIKGISETTSCTLYFKKVYYITYDLDGGVLEKENPSFYTSETNDIVLNNPSKKGSKFIGWSGSNGEEAQEIVVIKKGTSGDLRYKANYERITHEVRVVIRNGKILGETKKTVNEGNSANFTLEVSEENINPSVECDNNVKGVIKGNTLTVLNVTSNTTCNVSYEKTSAGTILDKEEKDPEGNEDGLKKEETEPTDQVPESKEEVIYVGSNENVKNYCLFNNEEWRIIGVYEVDNGSGKAEKRLKLVRESSIGKKEWNTDTNEYNESSIKEYLNNEYLNSMSETSKSMIGESKWYLGKTNENSDSRESYKEERSGTESYVGKVGLMYPSEYGKASKECNNESLTNQNEERCKESNWIYKGKSEWMISPSKTEGQAKSINEEGNVSSAEVNTEKEIRPTVYIKREVSIGGGEGSRENPYVLTLKGSEEESEKDKNIYKITYDLEGGSLKEENPSYYTSDSEDIEIYNPIKEGYKFIGWTGSNSDSPELNVTIPKGSKGDKHYKANYEKKKYSVKVTVQNGTIEGDGKGEKEVEVGGSLNFYLKGSSGYSNPVVECTNKVVGIIRENILTIENVKENTICRVEYKKVGTGSIIEKEEKDPENNEDGLKKEEQEPTEQVPSKTEEIRYEGSNEEVRNYVRFNDEEWRIVGVFEVEDASGKTDKRLKLVRESSIGRYSWDRSEEGINAGKGISQWGRTTVYDGADLMRLINEESYYKRTDSFSTSGLKEESKKLIDEVKWYLGAVTSTKTVKETYKEERSNELPVNDTGINIRKTTNYVGSVGLIYPSDYGYGSRSCKEKTIDKYNECKNDNWLYKGINEWMLSPYKEKASSAINVKETGEVGYKETSEEIEVRPAVYLKPEVELASGNGTRENPYTLKLEESGLIGSDGQPLEIYGITYDLDGGKLEKENPASYTKESETFTLNNPNKKGTNFIGWTGSNGNTPEINVTIPKGSTGNKSYKANYEAVMHTVEATITNGALKENEKARKEVESTGSVSFELEVNETNINPKVECTNNQKGIVKNKVLTVENVTKDTVCHVEYEKSGAGSIIDIVEREPENNEDGLEKIIQPETDQVPESKEEVRYTGSNEEVKNYVRFNNETWRLIGVFDVDNGTGKFEKRMKIIREDSIGAYSYDTSAEGVNSGWGYNQWGENESYEGADLMRLLNPGYESESINNSLYYNRSKGTCYTGRYNAVTENCDFTSTGLTKESREMIDDAKWYLGATVRGAAPEYSFADTETTYKEERSNNKPVATAGMTNDVSWVGKVGLMYASDYGYGSNVCSKDKTYLARLETKDDYRQSKCTSSNWLYQNNGLAMRLMSPSNEYNEGVRYVGIEGFSYTVSTHYAGNRPRPTVYLKSNVIIKSGEGTKVDPYELELKTSTEDSVYSISYDLDGGIVKGENPRYYNRESESIVLKSPSKENYEFIGWIGSNGSIPELNVTIEKGSVGDKHYKANYKANEYRVEVTVQNGTVEGYPYRDVSFGGSANFTLVPTEENTIHTVSCTNGIKAIIKRNTLTVENITSDTVCSVSYEKTSAGSIIDIVEKNPEGNEDGLTKETPEETDQIPESKDEYRYGGSNEEVKNYVNFNNETWRIIGAFEVNDLGKFEKKLKLVRDDMIGNYSWDSSLEEVNSGNGINQWGSSGTYEGADLMKLLNPGYESESVNNSLYYNSGTGKCYNGIKNGNEDCNFSENGLKEESKKLISEAKWYLGAISENAEITAKDSYKEERGNLVGAQDEGTSITKTKIYRGKVGLIYPSDYGYASKECKEKNIGLKDYDSEECKTSNWMYKEDDGNQWLMSPFARYAFTSRAISGEGRGYIRDGYSAGAGYGIKPSVYLKQNVKIKTGAGTSTNPYELELIETEEETGNTIYNISYVLNGGKVSESNPMLYTKESESFTLRNPVKEDYNFIGWTGSNGEVPEKTVVIPKGTSGDKSYTANYQARTFTVIYNANGGTGTMSNSSHILDKSSKLSKNTYTRAGHDFLGWSTDPNAKKAKYTDEESIKNLAGVGSTVTLYAVWKIRSYEVIAKATNGTISGNSSQTVKYNSSTTFTVSANSGYGDPTVECVKTGTSTKVSIGSISGNTLTVKNVQDNVTCTVSYKRQYTVSATVTGGTIEGSEKKAVNSGNTTTFTFKTTGKPTDRYKITSAKCNGVNATIDGDTITTPAITGDTTCNVSYTAVWTGIPKSSCVAGNTITYAGLPWTVMPYNYSSYNGCGLLLNGTTSSSGSWNNRYIYLNSFLDGNSTLSKDRDNGGLVQVSGTSDNKIYAVSGTGSDTDMQKNPPNSYYWMGEGRIRIPEEIGTYKMNGSEWAKGVVISQTGYTTWTLNNSYGYTKSYSTGAILENSSSSSYKQFSNAAVAEYSDSRIARYSDRVTQIIPINDFTSASNVKVPAVVWAFLTSNGSFTQGEQKLYPQTWFGYLCGGAADGGYFELTGYNSTSYKYDNPVTETVDTKSYATNWNNKTIFTFAGQASPEVGSNFRGYNLSGGGYCSAPAAYYATTKTVNIYHRPYIIVKQY